MTAPTLTAPEDVHPWVPWAELRETHTAVVLLLGDRAYKVKKPVRFPFVDFSTRLARRNACRREVLLNRRLAPDVYLGVAVVTGPQQRVLDHLVIMRRMPAERSLARVLRCRAEHDDDVRAIARLIARFHAGADRSPEISVEGRRDALRRRWTDNFDQVRAYHGTVLPPDEANEAERLALRYLDGREPLLTERAATGRVVDGHGDLTAEDIFCLPDGPRVLDCLDFDDRLRYLDQLDDAAFLAMDIESLGRPEVAARYVEHYVEFSGDPAPVSLVHHYIAYRAFVRVKVDCLRHEQGDPDAADRARQLLRLTLDHLRAAPVRLVLVGGLPGTGKSTIAGRLTDQLGMVLLSSDRIRKELALLPPGTPAPARYREGLYSPDRTDAVYEELLRRAGLALGRGESVVLDASWSRAQHRDAAVALAERTCSDLVALRCVAPQPVAASRMVGRHGVSDADTAVAAAMARDADVWPQAAVLDTTGAVEDGVEQAVACIRSART
jgi:uncharacterized protein